MCVSVRACACVCVRTQLLPCTFAVGDVRGGLHGRVDLPGAEEAGGAAALRLERPRGAGEARSEARPRHEPSQTHLYNRHNTTRLNTNRS